MFWCHIWSECMKSCIGILYTCTVYFFNWNEDSTLVEKIGRLSQDNDDVVIQKNYYYFLLLQSFHDYSKSFGMDSMYQHSSCRHKTSMNDVDVWREFPKIAPDLE